MTIPEADAVSTLLRYLAPGSTVPAEDAADAAAYLTGKVHSALLAGPDPAQVREWVTAHAARVRVQRDEVERAQAKISEYENTTAWFTTCHGCAGHLDREYAADYRAAKAEAEVERLRAERNNAVATVAELAQRLTTREREHNADRAVMERLRAEVKRRDQDADRWRHVEPIIRRAQEKGCPYLDVDDLVDAVQDAETGADDGTCGDCATGKCHGTTPDDCGCDRHAASTQGADRG